VKTALLDLNILTALLWPTHEHHAAAHQWFGHRSRARWASCPFTQLGFVRLVTNPAFSRDALSPADAVTLLAENLKHPHHEFWPDALPVPRAVANIQDRLQGHRQLTDAYLIAVAHERDGVVATFDRGLRTLAGNRLQSVVEIVPTR
jgi:toxin-antitoxin system PIN domain toxin